MIERDGHGGRKLPVGIRCTAALRRGVFRFVAAIILAASTNTLVENLHTIRLEAYVFVAPIIDEPKLERYLDLRTSGHCTSARQHRGASGKYGSSPAAKRPDAGRERGVRTRVCVCLMGTRLAGPVKDGVLKWYVFSATCPTLSPPYPPRTFCE